MQLLREHGIFLTPYGVHTLPRAADTTKIKKQLAKGIRMPSGKTVYYDEAMTDALAAPWVQPDLVAAQLQSPRFKPTRAGMAATVTGLAFAPLVLPNLFNPRALMKLSIPDSDADGRVPRPWAPTDRRADPDCAARMLVDVRSRQELNDRVLESERHVIADQAGLAELIRREGVQEDLLGIIVNHHTPGLGRRLAATTIDGNSRLAIHRETFRDWVADEREEILDVVQSRRPRMALERLIDQLRDGLFALEFDDPVALRHLIRAIDEIIAQPTQQLIDTKRYAVPNLLVVPFTLIVAFEPHDDGSTVLDAADTLMRNLHHPSRASTRWDQSAGHAEIRDEIIAKLYEAGDLELGEALLLGPKFEEAARRHGQPAEPDRRAMAVMELINGDDDTGRKARAIFGSATGKPRPGRRERARLIVAAISEQLPAGNAKLRSDFETATQDVLDSPRYGSVKYMTVDGRSRPSKVVEQAKIELKDGKTAENGEWLMELGLKGTIALAALGHLRREYGQTTAESPRPYQIIDNMLTDTLGLELLGDAIQAWRDGTWLPDYDPETRKPAPQAGALRPATLSALFGGSRQAPPAPNVRDLCTALQAVLDEQFMPTYEQLMKLPEVTSEGVPPASADPIIATMDKVRRRLELRAEFYREFYGESDNADDDE